MASKITGVSSIWIPRTKDKFPFDDVIMGISHIEDSSTDVRWTPLTNGQ